MGRLEGGLILVEIAAAEKTLLENAPRYRSALEQIGRLAGGVQSSAPAGRAAPAAVRRSSCRRAGGARVRRQPKPSAPAGASAAAKGRGRKGEKAGAAAGSIRSHAIEIMSLAPAPITLKALVSALELRGKAPTSADKVKAVGIIMATNSDFVRTGRGLYTVVECHRVKPLAEKLAETTGNLKKHPAFLPEMTTVERDNMAADVEELIEAHWRMRLEILKRVQANILRREEA